MNKNIENFIELDIRVGKIVSAEEFPEIIKSFRTHLDSNIIECNTNGDKLTSEYAHSLFENGLSLLYINLYDGAHQMEHFDEVMRDIPDDKYKYRMHWSMKDHGLILNNRSGTIDWLGIEESDIKSLQGKPCHYPSVSYTHLTLPTKRIV